MHLSLHRAVVHRDLEVFDDGRHCACHDAMQSPASVLSLQGQGNGLWRDLVPSEGAGCPSCHAFRYIARDTAGAKVKQIIMV